MRGKQGADDTTRGMLLRRQKMVEPALRVSAYVDAVAHQSLLRWEKEGQGPIVVKAGEQSMTTDDANTLFYDGAARQGHWDPR